MTDNSILTPGETVYYKFNVGQFVEIIENGIHKGEIVRIIQRLASRVSVIDFTKLPEYGKILPSYIRPLYVVKYKDNTKGCFNEEQLRRVP